MQLIFGRATFQALLSGRTDSGGRLIRSETADDGVDAPGADDDALRVAREIAESGLRDLDWVASTIVGMLQQQLPHYGASSMRSGDDDLRTSVERFVRLVLACILEDRDPDPTGELTSFRLVGSQRAREGHSPDVVAAAHRLCCHGLQTVLLRHADVPRPSSPRACLTAAAVISGRVEQVASLIQDAIDDGYALGQGRLELLGRSAGEIAWANLLLDGRWRDETAVRAELMQLGRPLGYAHKIVIVAAPASPADSRFVDSARDLVSALGVTALLESPRSHPFGYVPVVLSASSAEDLPTKDQVLAAAVKTGTTVVLAEPVDVLQELPTIYRRAEAALPYLPAAATDSGIVSLRRVEMFSVVLGDGDLARMQRFVDDVLGPVERHRHGALMISIVESYYRSAGTWKDVTKAVHKHRNSLVPHIQQIEQLTGLAFDRPADLHELMTAARMRQYLRHEFNSLDIAE